MSAEGVPSKFPIEELSIIGFAAIPRRLPLIVRRIREVANAVLKARPDVLVIIDSPDFTHRVARRVRAADRSIPVVDYVSPSVWAWRSGRARRMRAYVDHVLALLPFEPRAHDELGGPPCTYVGHPLLEQVDTLRPNAAEAERRAQSPPVLVVLPGSRRVEIRRHMAVFGAALERLRAAGTAFEPVLPTLPHLAELVRRETESWQVKPRIEVGEDAKRKSFRVARAALAKSGTVTLELALARVPLVAAYKVSGWEAWIARRVIRVPSVILANLVIGENVVPEFLQEDCAPEILAAALGNIISEGTARQRQVDAFARLDEIMSTGELTPSDRAAAIVIETMRTGA